MKIDRLPTCKYTWVEDRKQEIYLEWPKARNLVRHINALVLELKSLKEIPHTIIFCSEHYVQWSFEGGANKCFAH